MNKENMIKAGIAGIVLVTYVGGYLYANSIAKDTAITKVRTALVEKFGWENKDAVRLVRETSFDAGVSLGFSPYLSNLKVANIISADSVTLNNIDNESKSFDIEFDNLTIDTSGIRYGSPSYHRFLRNILSDNNIPDISGLSGSINVEEDSTIASISDEHGSVVDVEMGFNATQSLHNLKQGDISLVFDANGSYALLQQLRLDSLPYEVRENIASIAALNVDSIILNINPDEDEIVFDVKIDANNLELSSNGVIPSHPGKFEDDLELNSYLSYSSNPEATKHLLEQLPYEFRALVNMINPESIELTLNIDDGEASWEFEAETTQLSFESSGEASSEDLDFTVYIENASGKDIYAKLGLGDLISPQVSNYKKILEDEDAINAFASSSEAPFVKVLTGESDADDALEEMVDFLEDPKSIKITVDADTKDFMSATKGQLPDVEKLKDVINITLN